MDFNLQTVKADPEGHYILLDAIFRIRGIVFKIFMLQISQANKFNFSKISQKKLTEQSMIRLLLSEATLMSNSSSKIIGKLEEYL